MGSPCPSRRPGRAPTAHRQRRDGGTLRDLDLSPSRADLLRSVPEGQRMHRASRATPWLATAAVVLGTAVAVVSGALGWRWVCAVALVVATLGEPVLHRRARRSVGLLRRAGLGLLFRSAVRFAAVLAVGGASNAPPGWMFAAAAVGGVFLALL